MNFVDSTLSYSIIEMENEAREVARIKAVAEQNRIDNKENVIYLTFDDGPTSYTDELLDILGKYQIKATFFMIGPRINEHPEAVKRMHQEGHGLALHGMTHDVQKIYNNHFSPSEEMKENQEILESITGVSSKLIRPPYGSIPYLTESMRYVLDQNGFKIWDWNVDSLDWDFNNIKYVQHTINEIKRLKKLGITPVVLLHDKKETVKHLPKLLSFIKKQGYQTKIISSDQPALTFSCDGRCRPAS
jgi:peptidoglycan-N-acetylglucosamine deacetylase